MKDQVVGKTKTKRSSIAESNTRIERVTPCPELMRSLARRMHKLQKTTRGVLEIGTQEVPRMGGQLIHELSTKYTVEQEAKAKEELKEFNDQLFIELFQIGERLQSIGLKLTPRQLGSLWGTLPLAAERGISFEARTAWFEQILQTPIRALQGDYQNRGGRLAFSLDNIFFDAVLKEYARRYNIAFTESLWATLQTQFVPQAYAGIDADNHRMVIASEAKTIFDAALNAIPPTHVCIESITPLVHPYDGLGSSKYSEPIAVAAVCNAIKRCDSRDAIYSDRLQLERSPEVEEAVLHLRDHLVRVCKDQKGCRGSAELLGYCTSLVSLGVTPSMAFSLAYGRGRSHKTGIKKKILGRADMDPKVLSQTSQFLHAAQAKGAFRWGF